MDFPYSNKLELTLTVRLWRDHPVRHWLCHARPFADARNVRQSWCFPVSICGRA